MVRRKAALAVQLCWRWRPGHPQRKGGILSWEVTEGRSQGSGVCDYGTAQAAPQMVGKGASH